MAWPGLASVAKAAPPLASQCQIRPHHSAAPHCGVLRAQAAMPPPRPRAQMMFSSTQTKERGVLGALEGAAGAAGEPGWQQVGKQITNWAPEPGMWLLGTMRASGPMQAAWGMTSAACNPAKCATQCHATGKVMTVLTGPHPACIASSIQRSLPGPPGCPCAAEKVATERMAADLSVPHCLC